MAAACTQCDGPLSPQNRVGVCRRCYFRWRAKDPEFQRRRSAGIKAAMRADPERHERYAARAREIAKLPQTRAASSRHCFERRLWELGQAAQGPGSEARAKAARTNRERWLSWCPPHLRNDYAALRAKHVRPAEARRLILEHHEVEMRRWRQSIGAAPCQ